MLCWPPTRRRNPQRQGWTKPYANSLGGSDSHEWVMRVAVCGAYIARRTIEELAGDCEELDVLAWDAETATRPVYVDADRQLSPDAGGGNSVILSTIAPTGAPRGSQYMS